LLPLLSLLPQALIATADSTKPTIDSTTHRRRAPILLVIRPSLAGGPPM
jgi:hypothetical protein